jgi:hypothetical protein
MKKSFPTFYEDMIPDGGKQKMKIDLEKNGKIGEYRFICKTCRKYLKKGKIPPIIT